MVLIMNKAWYLVMSYIFEIPILLAAAISSHWRISTIATAITLIITINYVLWLMCFGYDNFSLRKESKKR